MRLRRRRKLIGTVVAIAPAVVVTLVLFTFILPPPATVVGFECGDKVPVKPEDAVRIAAFHRSITFLHLRLSGERVTVEAAFVNASGFVHDVDCRTLTPAYDRGLLRAPFDGQDHFGWMVWFLPGRVSTGPGCTYIFLVDWSSGQVATSLTAS